MLKSISILIALLALSGGVAQAVGGYSPVLGKLGDPAKVSRSIEIATSDDMRYSPDEVTIKRGQTIRFSLVNGGHLEHMMVLESMVDLKKDAMSVLKTPTLKVAGPNVIRVAPGKTGYLVWYFPKAGEIDFGCLVPGHMEAGMHGKIIVRP